MPGSGLPVCQICESTRHHLLRLKRLIACFRNLTSQLGEPGHTPPLMDEAEVVGWGQTGTEKDEEIDIVPTAAQQKLKLPVISNEDCGTKYYEDLGLDIRGEIR